MIQRTNLKKISREVEKYFELNEIKNITYQNLWGAGKAVLREKFMSLNSYIRKEDQSKINNLSFHLRKVEKAEQYKPKATE